MLFLKSLNDIDHDDIHAFSNRFSEGIRVEYKRNFDQNVRKKIPKIVSSFANSYGGVLILGIKTKNGKTVKPFEGFEKNEKEEIELTVENLCLEHIYPIIIPNIKVVELPDSIRVFVVIEVPESSNAPHAIENSTKIYIRTGNQSSPYELSDLERIESLIQKRDKSSLIKEEILNRSLGMIHEFHQTIPDPNVPNITVISHPLFMQRPISGLEVANVSARNFILNTVNHFNIGDRILRFQGGIISRMKWSDANIYAFNLCGEFGEVFFHQSLDIHITSAESSITEEDKESYISLAECITTIAYNLMFAEYFYNNCNYRGESLIRIELNNVLNQKILIGEKGWRNRGNLYSIQKYIFGESQFSTENISEDIVRIIAEVVYNLVWAFNQSYDSFSMEYVQSIVTDVLQNNKIIS